MCLYLWLCVIIAHRFNVTIHKNHVILHSLTFQSTYMTMITKHLFFILYYYNIYIYSTYKIQPFKSLYAYIVLRKHMNLFP